MKRNFVFGCISVIAYSILIVYIPQIIQACLDNIIIINEKIFYNQIFKLVFIVLLKVVFEILYVWLFELFSSKKIYMLNIRLINKITKYDWTFFSKTNLGDLIEYLENDMNKISSFFSTTFPTIISELVLTTGVLISVYSRVGFNSFALFVLLIFASGVIILNFKKNDEQYIIEEREYSSEVFYEYNEWLANRKIINLLNLKGKVENIFDEYDLKWLEKKIKSQKYIYSVWALSIIIGAVFSSIAIFISGINYYNQAISIGTVYLIINYSKMLLEPISYIQSTVQSYKNYKASNKRINMLLSQDSQLKTDGNLLDDSIFNVQIVNLSYKYEDSIALIDVNMTINMLDKIVIVGKSGSGKSTIAKLLSKLLTPPNGSILVNRIDINNYDLMSYSSKVAYLSHIPFIVDKKTIKENLSLFDESIDENKIISFVEQTKLYHLLDISDAYEFLNKVIDKNELPNGFLQIINISRLCFQDKLCVILDESFLDINLEWYPILISVLEVLSSDKTLIIITHNTEFVNLYSDMTNIKVIRLEDGSII